MTPFRRLRWGAAIAVLAGLTSALEAGECPQHVLEIRIALVQYQGLPRDISSQVDRLANLEKIARDEVKQDVHFQIALGSYGEVLEWFEKGEIDAAFAPPGVFAEIASWAKRTPTVVSHEYIATVDKGRLPESCRHIVRDSRIDEKEQGTYRGMCLTKRRWNIESIDDLVKRPRPFRCFLNEPLSASGGILPVKLLAEKGIPIRPEMIEYKRTHGAVVEALANADENGPPTIGFVYDGIFVEDDARKWWSQLKQVRFPALDDLEIPEDVLVVRKEGAESEEISRVLKEACRRPTSRFRILPAGESAYDVIPAPKPGFAPLTNPGETVMKLEDVLWALRSYELQRGRPRVALVLTGGGAKCAYQIGVIDNIERELGGLRSRLDSKVDIDLVVGTSGGALNALPVAMGTTSYPGGIDLVKEQWRAIRRSEILRLPVLTQLFGGALFGLLLGALGVAVSGAMRGDNAPRRRRILAVSVPAVLLGVAVLVVTGALSIDRLPTIPLVALAGWVPVVAAVTTFLVFGADRLSRARAHGTASRLLTLTVLVLVTGGLGAVNVLFWQDSLFSSTGLESAVRRAVAKIARETARHDGTACAINEDSDLETLGAALIETKGLLKRDLVVTAGCLNGEDSGHDTDVYCYYGEADGPPKYGPSRGVSILQWKTRFLNLVLGSASIYPVFPAQRVLAPGASDPASSTMHLDLVDGGFAHNTPLEAALAWGATHVIVVGATAAESRVSGCLWRNTMDGISFLHQQAQLLDTRSRGRACVYSIFPSSQKADVLDFDEGSMGAAWTLGEENTLGLEGKRSVRSFLVDSRRPEFRGGVELEQAAQKLKEEIKQVEEARALAVR